MNRKRGEGFEGRFVHYVVIVLLGETECEG